MSINSFGYFLEAVKEKLSEGKARPTATAQGSERPPSACDDPQLTILDALARHEGVVRAIDLMRETGIAPTALHAALKIMRELGLIKIEPPADAASATAPEVQLTPDGRKAIEIYRG
jgi:DNA-binding MarR family transcriptional regulator